MSTSGALRCVRRPRWKRKRRCQSRPISGRCGILSVDQKMVRLALPLLPLAGLPERLRPGKFDEAFQPPDEDLPVT